MIYLQASVGDKVEIAMELEDAFSLLGSYEEGDSLRDSRAGRALLDALKRATAHRRLDPETGKVVPR